MRWAVLVWEAHREIGRGGAGWGGVSESSVSFAGPPRDESPTPKSNLIPS